MAEYIHIPTGTHVEAEGVLPPSLFRPADESDEKAAAKPAPRKRTAKKAAAESR